MKILYVGLKSDFICPTSARIAKIFSLIASNIRYCGPGYSDEYSSIDQLCDTFAPDFIVTTDYFLSLSEILGRASVSQALYETRRLPDFKPDEAQFRERYDHITSYLLKRRSIPLLVTTLETDLYKASTNLISLIDSADLILGPGRQFTSTIVESPRIHRESFGHLANDLLANLFESAQDRLVSFLDFVDCEDFHHPNSHQREHLWCIPGVEYQYRKEAIRHLRNHGFNPQHGRSLPGRLLYHHTLPNHIRRIGLDLYRGYFRSQLRASKLAYTCGSGGRAPVTKMFEIPAYGCLLVAEGFYNCSQAGFEDGVNYIEAKPDDLAELTENILNHQEDYNHIANCGYRHVWQRHSLPARVNQLTTCLRAYLNGTFRGSEWSEGQYLLL